MYLPETERVSHYFRSVLPDEFDAFIWLEETGAVTPIPTSDGQACRTAIRLAPTLRQQDRWGWATRLGSKVCFESASECS
jgi:hypothetical protein